ncbi:MAG: hypothetical protein GY887_09295 [Halieaceae bacterium]|nr:hypothetical protein [Halieaceae bacterium]MCP4851344.1 hypothetical protein [Actinomycetes bacterium]
MLQLAMAGLSFASSFLGSKGGPEQPEQPPDTSYRATAKETGRSNAQVEMSKQRAQAALPAVAKSIRNAQALGKLQVVQNANAAAAQAAVEAAATGTTGASVTATQMELRNSASRQKGNIDKQAEQDLRDTDQQYADLEWDAHNQHKEFYYDGNANVAPRAENKTSTGDRLLAAGLAGAGAYLGAAD